MLRNDFGYEFLVKYLFEWVPLRRVAGARVVRTGLLVLNHTLITTRRYRVRMCTRDIGINFNERSVRLGSTCSSGRLTENWRQGKV